MTTTEIDSPERRVDMCDRPSFNLVEAAWLRARLIDGTSETLSLRSIFARLDNIAVLDGESPTQDTAVFRLLLAILIRSLRCADVLDPQLSTVETWETIASANDLGSIVDDYLTDHRDRFDLFHPHVPFFQVADLETKKSAHPDASVLVPDVGPGLFSTRTREDAQVLDPASAARWLVRVQAYDISGIKSGALGDPRVKNGKGYPIGTGWAGAIGSVMLTGRTLHDTLLLNLPVEAVIADRFIMDLDLPPWERERDTAAPRSDNEAEPNGIVDLLTWQQRRVRLFPADDSSDVVGALICNGDKLARANRIDEPYAAQRYSAQQSKKAAKEIRYARQLDPTLTVWRGVQAVFTEANSPTAAASSQGRDHMPDTPAPVLEQFRKELGDVVEARYGRSSIGLDLTGIAYGTQDAFIETEIRETLPVSFSLFTAAGQPLRRTAITAVDRVLLFRGRLRWFYRQLLVCAGASPDDYPDEQVSAWLDELQMAFTSWLAALGDGRDPQQADLDWRRTMWTITRRAIEQGVEQAGPRAAIGTFEVTDSGSALHTSARYEAWIVAQLAEATGSHLTPPNQQNSDPPSPSKESDTALEPGVTSATSPHTDTKEQP